jgi:RNA polymerase sigma factor (sigma-70 family)
MSGDTTADVGNLIERLRRGDASARRELLDRIYHRLRRIAAATFRKEFGRLGGRHDVDSVVDEAWVRLLNALELAAPKSADEFYNLMFLKVRQVLLDMARRQTRDDGRLEPAVANGTSGDRAAPALHDVEDTTHEPSRLAFWTELHREVAALPEKERVVFEFHYFADFPQSEIARLLDLHPKQVSRLWIAATARLAIALGEDRTF